MLLVAGSANVDFVVQAPQIPRPGETVLGHHFQTFPGGKGANQAVAAAVAGSASTHLLLGLGNDAWAAPLEASLTQAGVTMHIVRSTTEPTGCAFICVSDQAENAITVAPGANATLRPEHLPALQGFSHLLLQLETPMETVCAYAQAARAQGVCVVLNAAPARALPHTLLEHIDILIVNEGELACIAAHHGSVADGLQGLAVPTVVVTLGHRGSCARHQGQWLLQGAYPISPIDTTAAGDTFCGSLVAALSQGHTLPAALQWASAASALACTRRGAQSSIPTQAQVQSFMAQTHANSTQALRSYCGLS